jgi:hypothetical protein
MCIQHLPTALVIPTLVLAFASAGCATAPAPDPLDTNVMPEPPPGQLVHTIHLEGELKIKSAGSDGKLEPEGNWGASCISFDLTWADFSTFAILGGNCFDTHGVIIHSTMDLNACLANANANLQFQHAGDFQASCRGDRMNSTIFGSNCNAAGPGNFFTNIDLNRGISNQDGHLACD